MQSCPEVFLSPCTDFYDKIISVFNAVPPEGSEDQLILIFGLDPCADYSKFCEPYSNNNNNNIYCRCFFHVEGYHSELFPKLEDPVFLWIGESLPIFFLRKSVFLK